MQLIGWSVMHNSAFLPWDSGSILFSLAQPIRQ